MKKVICCVKDVKAGAFVMDPIAAITKGVAIRAFIDAVNNDELPFKKHPGDYQLWVLGELDCVSGSLIVGKDGPELVGDATQFVEVTREL